MVKVRETFSWLLSSLVAVTFEYDTPKYVHIKNKKVGLINRLVQLGIVGYIIGYGIIWKHGAQKSEPVQSVVTTKLKGVNILNASSEEFMVNCPKSPYNLSIYDHVDLTVPPKEPNTFFVTTNMWVTCGQSYGFCPEDDSVPNAICSFDDNTCPIGQVLPNGNGLTTGNCTPNGTCEIYSWCPTEQENDNLTALGPKIDTRNFTVLIKNTISFPNLDPSYRVRNIPDAANSSFLKHCRFNASTEEGLFCPIFTLKQIVDMIKPDANDAYYDELATIGAVVGLIINWDCNLDFNSKYCRPTYSARRLDNPDAKISKGFNFRYARYYREDGIEVRDVFKVYGINFEVQVTGTGRKFDFTTLVLALGSTIALLAIATTVTDIIALYLLKKGTFYRQKKYQKIEGDDYTAITQTESMPILQDSQSPRLINLKK